MPKGCLSTVGRTIFRRKRNLSRPWKVANLERILENEEERIHIVHDGSKPLVCSVYERACSCYDHRYRRWRHLDSLGYPSDLVCEVLRFSCPEHGVVTVTFEAMVIDGIKACVVSRGLARQEHCKPIHVCVDETSFRKRHDDVTVVSDVTTGTVHCVGDGRRKGALNDWSKGLSREPLGSIGSVSLDMWPAYITSTLDLVPGARDKIAFDRFHVMRKMNAAVDKVRRREHKSLSKADVHDPKGTKSDWLTNHATMPEGQRRRFR